jgi:hypothetical protein
MRPYADSPSPTADERLREVASILAAGILRLRARAALAAAPDPLDPRILLGLGQDCLDVPLETVLSVHTG